MERKDMNKFNTSLLAAIVACAFSAGAMAAGISKDEYKSGKDKAAADYKAAKGNCKSLSGNAKDICMAEAKGKEKVAKAELEARYKDTDKARKDALVAKAEADYSIAKEKCEDQKGSARSACKKDAKSAYSAAKADAKANRKT